MDADALDFRVKPGSPLSGNEALPTMRVSPELLKRCRSFFDWLDWKGPDGVSWTRI
jgi:hypothetical protein